MAADVLASYRIIIRTASSRYPLCVAALGPSGSGRRPTSPRVTSAKCYGLGRAIPLHCEEVHPETIKKSLKSPKNYGNGEECRDSPRLPFYAFEKTFDSFFFLVVFLPVIFLFLLFYFNYPRAFRSLIRCRGGPSSPVASTCSPVPPRVINEPLPSPRAPLQLAPLSLSSSLVETLINSDAFLFSRRPRLYSLHFFQSLVYFTLLTAAETPGLSLFMDCQKREQSGLRPSAEIVEKKKN